MNIFLTGASGFVGSEFINYVKNKKKIFIHSIGNSKSKNKKIKFYKGRLHDNFDKALINSDVLLHLASEGVNNQNISYQKMYKTNVTDSLKLFTSAIRNQCLNWVVAGSSSEYGKVSYVKKKLNRKDTPKPVSNYAKTKYLFIKKVISLAKKNHVNLRVMRIFPLYGESENKNRLFSIATRNARRNKNIELNNGLQLRDYLNVKIAVKMLFQSLFFKKKKSKKHLIEIWHIASGKPTLIKDFVKKIYNELSSKGKIILKDKNQLTENLHHCSDKISIWNYSKIYKTV
jgi:nucleoside-diphosphate-sugar epimerase